MTRDVSIIGTGALGATLARALKSADITVKSLFNRHPNKAKNLARSINVEQAGEFPQHQSDLGIVIFLTVPDRHIEEIAEKIASLSDDFSGFFVIHCSGSKPSSCLSALEKKGAAVACFHPLQTFTNISEVADLKNIYFDIEGNENALRLLKKITNLLHSNVILVSSKAKSYIHAAAVMASNNLVALMESAGQIAEMGGIEKRTALSALLPLVQKTLTNISENEEIYDALSGPVKRGDAPTIAEHLQLLEQNPRLLALYKQLGSVLIEISEASSNQSFGEINRLLNEQDTDKE